MPPRDNGTTTTSEHPLGDYVRAFMDRTGLGVRQLARQSVDPETRQSLNHSYISALASGEVPRVPDMWRLRALAAGMRGDGVVEDGGEYRRRLEEIKRLAAIEWLELGDVLSVDTGGGTWITVSVPAHLSERRRAMIRKIAETMAQEYDEED